MAMFQISYIRAVANDQHPSNRIRELREMHGISQAELARRANVSPSALNKVELGARGLDQEWMRRLARVLGCAPADLLPVEDNPNILSPDELQMIEAYRRANARDREYFGKVADAIIPWKGKSQDEVA